MAVEDNMIEDPVSSLVLKSLESDKSGEVLSTEDVAWADSCLTNDPEIWDSELNSLTEAVLEILSIKTELGGPSVSGADGFPGGTDIEILPSAEEAQSESYLGRAGDNLVVSINEAETSSNSFPLTKGTDIFQSDTLKGTNSKTYSKVALLQNFKEGQKVIEDDESGLNLGSSANEVEPSKDDIFKVWDLDIPEEEDELVKDLKMALADSSLRLGPSTSSESEESIINLIAGVANISLNQNSS